MTKVRSRPRLLWLIGLLLIGLTTSQTLVHLLTEVWWFNAAGFASVFWIRLRWQVAIAAVTFVICWLALYLNYRIAQQITRDRQFIVRENRSWDPYVPLIIRYASLTLITLLALSTAIESAGAWETVLKFLNLISFEATEPLYGRDISFYIFRLPLYEQLHKGLLELLIWSVLIPLGLYGFKGEIRPERGWKYFLTGEAKTHICILLSLLAIAIALGFGLARYQLLYSSDGVVFGAGYVDAHARLQSYWVLGLISLVVAGLFWVALWRSGFLLPISAAGFFLVALVLLGGLYPWAQEKFVVEPNELEKETPYIDHNISLTRQAYGLTVVRTEGFEVENQLSATELWQNSATVDNIRLWDYRPLLDTYSSLQTLRPYYRFRDVDIDRYTLNGDYRQVMLSPRELQSEALPDQAKTWVNQRLVYTHGYGLVMSPVNQVTEEGLPELLIKDLPPQSSVDLTIEQPRIYYGELTDQYILTGTTQQEFDYPLGGENATHQYEGAGGVPIGSLGRQLAYAYDMGSVQLLLSNYLTGQSRIHYHRDIRDRIHQIAPFLLLDNDPYMAVIDGRLQWIVDGYTLSNRYPYAEPLALSNQVELLLSEDASLSRIAGSGTNYIRNAVKATVDAYDGTLHLYVSDPSDPILTAYRRIFPNLFETEIPAALAAHFRYPNDLFKIQAQMYRAYHMQRPGIFYNQEDLWDFPTQVSREETVDVVEPYYAIMRLPQTDREAFMLILPFTPVSKHNMIAWMTALCDGENYGELLVYEFSKQSLIYGPRQIETRIDQNPEISEQLTLWNQQGSEVFRGDLLVIPIDQSLLYVEPVYLQATGQSSAIPELKRVILAYRNAVVMANTLDEAIVQVFGEAAPQPEPAAPQPAEPAPSATQQQNIKAALEAYEQGQAALQAGDWTRYGETQQRLGELLEQLNQ
ncbi:MAG: UPF0182 family protein [Leptolyngbya sp. SIO4C1]|nr:UPF0182 family protein [Leptolyngbya sp. SIO4C1]